MYIHSQGYNYGHIIPGASLKMHEIPLNGHHSTRFYHSLSPTSAQSDPLVNCYITMENHHATNGTTHYQWPFSSLQSVSH